MYFTSTIDGIESWLEIYQNTHAFESLVKAIFNNHSLPYSDINKLTPGSNAIFRVGEDFVIKLFAPAETEFANPKAFAIEKTALKYVNQVTRSPKLIASGVIHDKYSFHYIIMECIDGDDFVNLPLKERLPYVYEIKKVMRALNVPLNDDGIPVVTLNDCLSNQRWDHFPERFNQDRKEVLKNLSFENPVYVHGDLKAANLIVNKQSQIYVIDFADSHLAPPAYEWPYMTFGLFGCDPEMMQAYFGDYQNDDFILKLSNHLLMHKFGALLLMQICELQGMDIEELATLENLYQLIRSCLEEGNLLTE
ncbi:phosphotransferase [Amphibacillus sp. Q70]|uniref:phosphotransferase n=1 Tax=Amphibacillus sp. Q70 TaxID=3453416 RepID=UPI003F851045